MPIEYSVFSSSNSIKNALNVYLYFRIKFILMSLSTAKPVTLEGSCHCQRVKYSVDSCMYISYENILSMKILFDFRYTLSLYDLSLSC
jgi:hypothetical protein